MQMYVVYSLSVEQWSLTLVEVGMLIASTLGRVMVAIQWFTADTMAFTQYHIPVGYWSG